MTQLDKLSRIKDQVGVVWHRLFGRWQRRVVYVSDGANWSFYWDAHYTTEGLKRLHGVPTAIVRKPWHLRNQIIHFGDRYAYFNGPRERLHPSNEIFLTWFHGDPDDPNPEMQKLFAKLPGIVDGVRKVVVSCEISRQVLIGQGVSKSKIVKIPLGVDTSAFVPPAATTRQQLRAELGIPEDAFCIGSFQKDGAGWGDGEEPKLVKGPDVFLATIEKLKDRHSNLMVLLTGPARGYVKTGLDRLGVPFVHRYLDDYQDIVGCYQALDMYIIASRAEGGPKALLESWATGVPVVSTRMGMPADLIRHGENGMLADIDDAEALAHHADRLIADPDLHAQIKKTALADLPQFDWDKVADQYYKKLYAPLLEKTPNGR